MRWIVLLTASFWLWLAAPLSWGWMAPAGAQDATPAGDCPATTEEENRAIVELYYDVVSAFDLEALQALYAPVVIQHAADVPDARGAEEAAANIGIFLEAFPDLTHEIEQVITDGDLVAVRVIQSGTQQGDFLGIPATGRQATWTVIGIFRIDCGRIAEQWVEVDQITRLQQLGAILAFGASAASTPTAEASPAVPTTPLAACPGTTEEENAALVRRWYDEVWTEGAFDNLDELLAPDHIHHRVLNRFTSGAEARIRSIEQWRVTLPDLVTTPEFLLTEGDRVVARWTASGTHEGPWEDIPPTGNRVTWTGNTIFRIECGRIAEEWSEAASLSFFQQLGVIDWPPATDPEASPATN